MLPVPFICPLQMMLARMALGVCDTSLVSQPVAALSRCGGTSDSTSSLLMHICTVTGSAPGIFTPDFFICAATSGDSATSVLEVTFHNPTLPCLARAG